MYGQKPYGKSKIMISLFAFGAIFGFVGVCCNPTRNDSLLPSLIDSEISRLSAQASVEDEARSLSTISKSNEQISRKMYRRAIGGTETTIEGYPYMVSLLTRYKIFMCGGSIIGRNYVLTARHCLEFLCNGLVRAGSSSREHGGTMHVIIDFVEHEKYKSFPYGNVNDIGLIRVKEKFVYSNTIRPILLYGKDSGFEVSDQDLITVMGFGSTIPNGPAKKNLNVIEIPIVNKKKCSKSYSSLSHVDIMDDHFCAGDPEGKKDTCDKDSGSSAVFRGYQIGLVSYGYRCGLPEFPGVYTNVTYFSGWIKKKIARFESAGFWDSVFNCLKGNVRRS